MIDEQFARAIEDRLEEAGITNVWYVEAASPARNGRWELRAP